MKKLYIIAAALALVLTASCNRKVEFEHETFATLDAVTFSVDETVGKVVIPVSIYNPTGAEVQISVATVDGKAVEGTDYEIVSPASGLLTFTGEEKVKNIEVAITDFSGEFTGSKDFKVQIASATEGVSVGALNTASFTIKDLDHPLAAFIGDWAGSPLVDFFRGTEYALNITIAANEEDPTYSSLIISDLDPYFATNGINSSVGCNIFLGVVNEARNQILIESGQPMGYSTCQLIGFDGPDPESAGDASHFIINLNEDGTITFPNSFGVYNEGEGWYSAWFGGLTLSKK